MVSATLFQWADEKDAKAFSKQLKAVLEYLRTHDRVTLHDLAVYADGSESGCSARIRELRNDFGFDIRKARVRPGSRLYYYWLHKGEPA